MSQIERLYWIDSNIRSHRFPNAEQVSEQFGVSKRTAYSDRDHLITRLNAPLKLDTAKGGWFYTELTFVLPNLSISANDVSSIARSVLAALEYLGPEEAEPIRLIAERLALSASSLRDHSWESVSGSIHLRNDISISSALLADCETAIRRRRRLEIVYYTAHRNDTLERVLQPYHLHNHQGEWHLIGWCECRQAIRQFFLGRVRLWKLLPAEGAFVRQTDFDVNVYLKQGFGLRHGEELIPVDIRFSPYQARWARERIYHHSQTIEELPDGALILRLQVAGTAEIKRWILSYGPEVEVIAPEGLRREIIADAKQTLKHYTASLK